MTTARSSKIDLDSTPYYHCISRCVRRAYLCGEDEFSGKDYHYRKENLVSRFQLLASVFAIKICAYAVMSNHYHLVLFIDEAQAQAWTEEEVKARWAKLYPGDALAAASLNPIAQTQKYASWRGRLSSISWFMRNLNETIARTCNKEDEITGRFWEGRFASQALLDAGAVLSAMAYVDLNPVRAKIALTPESSEFTSIYERIKFIKETNPPVEQIDQAPQPKLLMPFDKKDLPSIDFKLSDYLALVDCTGRILREDKRGAIPDSLMPLLNRLQLSSSGWLKMVRDLEKSFFYAVGHCNRMALFSPHTRIRSPKGMSAALLCYQNVA